MAPTVQQPGRPSGSGSRDRRAKAGEKQKQLICKVKYTNNLPDIPFDPKFISYPFDSNRFVLYNPTSLERTFKFDLLAEHDLGVPIDLINPDAYVETGSTLHPDDEKLLEDEPISSTDSKRSRHHNKAVSWLRKTEYIASEYGRTQFKSDKAESKVGFNIKKLFNQEDLYQDRDSQLSTIEKSFEAVTQAPTKHHSKPGVTPVETMPVFPDFNMWKLPFAQVMFDSDPAPLTTSTYTNPELMSQAMIRGMKDESGEQFVAYFLPSEETMQKRATDSSEGLLYNPESQYDFTLTREYTWNVKNKATKGYEEMYFFLERGGSVFYNELETRVRLTKRRKAQTAGPAAKTRLLVRHRPMNEKEEEDMAVRQSYLNPPKEEYQDTQEDESADEGGSPVQSREQKDDEDKSSSSSSSSSSDSSSSDSSDSEDEKAGSASPAGDDEQEIFGSDSD